MGRKRVILIGDSIRMGYQATVAAALADVADVWGPEENGAHSVNILIHLHHWIIQKEFDVLHINCGLHDLRTIVYGERAPVVPLEHYRQNVETILRTIRQHCPGKIVWATTTPILYERAHRVHGKWQDFDRFEEDVVTYNRAAVEAATAAGVEINDLYSVVESAGREKILHDDGVHFTPEGYERLGKSVADFLRPRL
jgi:lysophospholipase L1-like esterase